MDEALKIGPRDDKKFGKWDLKNMPGHMNLEERTENKKTKYSHFRTELLRQNELKSLKLISLMIGTTGVILGSAVNN